MDPREQILNQIKESAGFITGYDGAKNYLPAEVGVILGSGLSKVADFLEESVKISYPKIPHFAPTTIQGHLGNLILGKFCDKNVLLLQGRYHFYEGYTMWSIGLPIRVLKKLGVKTLIVTCSAGGIRKDLDAGDIMIIDDHINLMQTNPLIGPNITELGERFTDLKHAYNSNLKEKILNIASELKINLKKGVYAALIGPSYETGAEINYLEKIGADAVGMSVVPEVIVAKNASLQVLGLAVIANNTKGLKEITHDEVLLNVANTSNKVANLLQGLVKIV